MLGALAFFAASVLRIDYSRTPYFDLEPGPDAPEYFAAAASFANEGSFSVHLAGRRYPSRYPIGYSFLISLWIQAGGNPIRGPFAVNQALGLALLAGVFSIFAARGRPAAGGLAALMLATLPAFVILSRSSMSGLSGGAMVLAAYFCLFRHLETRGVTWAWAGGFLLGVSLLFRLSSLFFGLAVLTPFFAGRTRAVRDRLLDCLFAAAGFFVGALPALLYNRAVFGGFTATGYGLWLPDRAGLGAFDLGNLPENLGYLLKETLDLGVKPTVASIFGEGSYFGPAFVVLSLWGLWRRRGNSAVVGLAVPGLFFLGAMASYFYQDARLLFPLMLLSIPLAADAAAGVWTGAGAIPRIAVAALVISHVMNYSGGSLRRAASIAYLDVSRTYGPAESHELVRRLGALRGSGPVLILTDVNPAYLFALTQGDRIVTFLMPEHDYRFNPSYFKFGEAELAEQVRGATAENRRVLAVCRRAAFDALEELFPPPEGRIWKVLATTPSGGGIAILEPAR